MSSFSVFMSPIVGIIIADFWVVRKKHLKLTHLYTDDKNGKYWYWKGINYRNLIIWVIAFTPGLPGVDSFSYSNDQGEQGYSKLLLWKHHF
nr:ASB_HP1_G0027010.mRNA.1.CDS.1 [Saccharomyces cerevisiae]